MCEHNGHVTGARVGVRAAVLVVSASVAMTVALTACSPTGTTAAASPSVSATEAPADRAGAVDIGDERGMYLECHGSGSPTVILVSGVGNSAEIWSTPGGEGSDTPTVYGEVAEFTRVCAYDRPGTSDRSTAVAQPTSPQTSVDDLEKLLAASGETGPFVLVGHSYGGPIIRLFASDHPDQVAGLVVIDGLSEDLDAELTPEQRVFMEELNAPTQPDAESFDLSTVVAQLRDSDPVPDVPVIILTADTSQLTPELIASGQLPAGLDQSVADALWAAQLAAQGKLPSKFAHAKHVTDTHSDHYIQLGNPQLVIDSIREVVDAAQSGAADG